MKGLLLRKTRDLVADAMVELHSRRARSLLMVLAVGLSSGALVASVGLSTTAARQVDADLAAETVDLLTVSVASAYQDAVSGPLEPVSDGDSSSQQLDSQLQFPWDAPGVASGVDLVAASGMRLDLDNVASVVVARDSNQEVGHQQGVDVSLIGITSGYPSAAQVAGPEAQLWQLDGDLPVAIVGPAAAKKLYLPITQDPTGLTVWIGETEYSVIGFFSGHGPQQLAEAVAIPYARAVPLAGGDGYSQLLVHTEPGGGARVAEVIRLALRPDAPQRLVVSQVVGMESLRRGVESQLSELAGWVAAILMSLTVLLIANAMVVAVTARIAEIGLRRALGSSRSRIGAVFLTEGLVVGLLGGVVGAAFGAVAIVIAAASSHWTAVMAPTLFVLAPVIGGAVGVAASLYPAVRAARINPALALRSD